MSKCRGGAYQAPHFGTALGGHRHEFFRVCHFQWESMGFEIGSVHGTMVNRVKGIVLVNEYFHILLYSSKFEVFVIQG